MEREIWRSNEEAPITAFPYQLSYFLVVILLKTVAFIDIKVNLAATTLNPCLPLGMVFQIAVAAIVEPRLVHWHVALDGTLDGTVLLNTLQSIQQHSSIGIKASKLALQRKSKFLVVVACYPFYAIRVLLPVLREKDEAVDASNFDVIIEQRLPKLLRLPPHHVGCTFGIENINTTHSIIIIMDDLRLWKLQLNVLALLFGVASDLYIIRASVICRQH